LPTSEGSTQREEDEGTVGKKEISVKSKLRLSKVTSDLDGLLSAMRTGRVFVQKGNEYVGLTLPKVVKAQIGAVQTKAKEGVTIKLSWPRPNGREEPTEQEPELKFLGEEPVVEPSATDV
jgi:hypothetical protein